jgi:hypothetical protein
MLTGTPVVVEFKEPVFQPRCVYILIFWIFFGYITERHT